MKSRVNVHRLMDQKFSRRRIFGHFGAGAVTVLIAGCALDSLKRPPEPVVSPMMAEAEPTPVATATPEPTAIAYVAPAPTPTLVPAATATPVLEPATLV